MLPGRARRRHAEMLELVRRRERRQRPRRAPPRRQPALLGVVVGHVRRRPLVPLQRLLGERVEVVEVRKALGERVQVRRDVAAEERQIGAPVGAREIAEHGVVGLVLADDEEHVLDGRRRALRRRQRERLRHAVALQLHFVALRAHQVGMHRRVAHRQILHRRHRHHLQRALHVIVPARRMIARPRAETLGRRDQERAVAAHRDRRRVPCRRNAPERRHRRQRERLDRVLARVGDVQAIVRAVGGERVRRRAEQPATHRTPSVSAPPSSWPDRSPPPNRRRHRRRRPCRRRRSPARATCRCE